MKKDVNSIGIDQQPYPIYIYIYIYIYMKLTCLF